LFAVQTGQNYGSLPHIYTDETAKRLEDIVHTLTEPVSTEIAVVSYSEQAA